MIISRIPLFFFQAVKASLLPALAARAADDDLDGFREVQLRLVGGRSRRCRVHGGDRHGRAVGGRDRAADSLGSRGMGLLAASGGGLMLMLSLSLGLVALNHTRLAIVGFLVAVVVFPIALQFPNEPFLQVEVGYSPPRRLVPSRRVSCCASSSPVTGLQVECRPWPNSPKRRSCAVGSRPTRPQRVREREPHQPVDGPQEHTGFEIQTDQRAERSDQGLTDTEAAGKNPIATVVARRPTAPVPA